MKVAVDESRVVADQPLAAVDKEEAAVDEPSSVVFFMFSLHTRSRNGRECIECDRVSWCH